MRGLLSHENIFIEPSSCAAFAAFLQSSVLQQYVKQQGLEAVMPQATHIAWATGGSMVPDDVRKAYLTMGL